MWILCAVLSGVLPLTAARTLLDPLDDGEQQQYPALVPYYESTLRPCPPTAPVQFDLDEALGSWHLALLLLADRSPLDAPLDESLCAGVEVVRTNGSMLRLDWALHQLGLPGGLADLHLQVAAALVGQPGLWALATPLGGEMLATVTHAAPRSHLVLTVCGDPRAARGVGRGAGRSAGRDEPQAVHVLTALLTRHSPSSLGSLELLRLAALMTPANGVRGLDQRLLSWGQC